MAERMNPRAAPSVDPPAIPILMASLLRPCSRAFAEPPPSRKTSVTSSTRFDELLPAALIPSSGWPLLAGEISPTRRSMRLSLTRRGAHHGFGGRGVLPPPLVHQGPTRPPRIRSGRSAATAERAPRSALTGGRQRTYERGQAGSCRFYALSAARGAFADVERPGVMTGRDGPGVDAGEMTAGAASAEPSWD